MLVKILLILINILAGRIGYVTTEQFHTRLVLTRSIFLSLLRMTENVRCAGTVIAKAIPGSTVPLTSMYQLLTARFILHAATFSTVIV
jgi:hypothetical protein